MKIYNSLTKRKEEFEPIEAGKVKMYACGITVSGEAHIGHAYQALIYDIMRKYLQKLGYRVTYARNYTDVDDKIIAKSRETGIPADVYAAEMIGKIDEVMRKFRVDDPDVWLKATENIGNIISFIAELIEKGHAYATKKGDVYFDVDTYPAYGHLSNRNIEDALDGVRVDNDDEKKNAYDFALWKSAKEGEICWDSPWGKGRPGWHIECSAMNWRYLGDTIDIHCGGQDLIFPHHENEIAQSECFTGKPFAHYWMHNGYINVDNVKMSKSLGNFFTVRDVAEKYGYEPIRYLLISAQYRSPINYSTDIIEQCIAALNRLYTCRDSLDFELKNAADAEHDGDKAIIDGFDKYREQFIAAMDDDLNTADAIASIFELVRDINTNVVGKTPSKALVEGAIAMFDELTGVLGLVYNRKTETLDSDVEALIEARTNARKEKNWAEADRIRDQLKEMGIVLEDTAQGVKWHRE